MTVPITAVVVTYNSAHCVEACLASLRKTVGPDEIVVVDNASSDGSVEAARRVAPEAVVIETGANLGFGRASNRGAASASSTYVMFVNPDVVFVRADRAALDAELEQRALGLLVPLLVWGGRPPQHYVYPYLSWPRNVLRQTWSHLWPRELRRRSQLAQDPADSWPAATVLLVRREEFLDAGGFDERYFLYAEDVDLARRYRARGLPVRLTNALVAEHERAGSSASNDDARPVPHAWSIIGTLEYVSIWDGEQAAARAAAMTLWSLRVQRLLLRVLPGLRMARKRRQVAAMHAFLLAHAAADARDGGFCPGARAALRASRLS